MYFFLLSFRDNGQGVLQSSYPTVIFIYGERVIVLAENFDRLLVIELVSRRDVYNAS